MVDVVLVVPPAQPPSTHASQQRESWLTHALPPLGATHVSADLLSEHFVRPFFVRQHATAPGFPHVERAAHFLTAPRHCLGRLGSAFASCTTQRTYWP